MRTKGAKDKGPRASRVALMVKLSELNSKLQPEATICVVSSYRRAFKDLGITFEEKITDTVQRTVTDNVELEEQPAPPPKITMHTYDEQDS